MCAYIIYYIGFLFIMRLFRKAACRPLNLKFFRKAACPFLNLKFFRKPTSPPLPLREGSPLISVFSPQGKRGNRPTRCSNRFAIWLADHQRSTPCSKLQFFVRDEPHGHTIQDVCCLLDAEGMLAGIAVEPLGQDGWRIA